MDVTLGLEETHVIVTGGAGLIGSKVVEAFLAAGANVTALDLAYSLAGSQVTSSKRLSTRHVNIADEESVTSTFALAIERFGTPAVCVCLAALDLSVLTQRSSSLTLSVEQFRRTIDVNVTGTFIVAREWLRGLASAKSAATEVRNASLIIVGSEAGRFGVTGNADYATSKSAVQVGLLRSLASDAPRIYPGARVNAVAPGPVDTDRFKAECLANPEQYYIDCQGTVPQGRPVPPGDVAKTIVVLASENLSGSVHGQLIPIDNGKAGKVVWTEGEAAKLRAG